MHREDKQALEIFMRKTEEVRYPLGETEEYQDQSKDILKSILNEDILSVSDSEEQIKES